MHGDIRQYRRVGTTQRSAFVVTLTIISSLQTHKTRRFMCVKGCENRYFGSQEAYSEHVKQMHAGKSTTGAFGKELLWKSPWIALATTTIRSVTRGAVLTTCAENKEGTNGRIEDEIKGVRLEFVCQNTKCARRFATSKGLQQHARYCKTNVDAPSTSPRPCTPVMERRSAKVRANGVVDIICVRISSRRQSIAMCARCSSPRAPS